MGHLQLRARPRASFPGGNPEQMYMFGQDRWKGVQIDNLHPPKGVGTGDLLRILGTFQKSRPGTGLLGQVSR
jgi:hypothetical protein